MKTRILSLLFALLLLISASALADGSRAVIANCKEYVTLRKSASSNAKSEIRMPLGEQVTVLEKKNGWAKVQYFDRTGYVPEKYLTPWQETAYTPRKSVSGHPVYCGNYGTAKHIEGRTVVVAIFADDATTSWNFNREADQHTRLRNRFNLSVACTWLTEQARRYRPNPGGFVWDWREHGDLYYTHAFTEDIVHGFGNPSINTAFNSYIHENIPTKKLLDTYNADNIIYMLYLNAPNSQDYRSWTNAVLYSEVPADKYVPEVCVIVPYGRGRENNPAVLAHEMLHCFGAYDLYETNPSSPIPQKYVNYLLNHKPNDLMNHCYFSAFDIVTVEFSEVDAYYVGLTDTCAAVKKWGLGPTIFQKHPANN
ncbi:MAG: SH3 domain-containing protein [Clostridia bacterium]|nr:SH3 domain-containing protein [Clostridia bacterium]